MCMFLCIFSFTYAVENTENIEARPVEILDSSGENIENIDKITADTFVFKTL